MKEFRFCRSNLVAEKLHVLRQSHFTRCDHASDSSVCVANREHGKAKVQSNKVSSLVRADSTGSIQLVERGCSVPTVTGASVTGTGCTEGGSADHGTTCTWAADDTHTCSNVGATTCSAGSFNRQTPSCVARHEEGLSTSGALTSEQCSRSRLF